MTEDTGHLPGRSVSTWDKEHVRLWVHVWGYHALAQRLYDADINGCDLINTCTRER
jgi:hypothetical protein